jgi:hypothetical protein
MFFKFKKSEGAQHARQTAQRRQPLINDLHVSNLYSDKVLAERQLRAFQTKYNALVREVDGYRDAAHQAMRDANLAMDSSRTLADYRVAYEQLPALQIEIVGHNSRHSKLTKARDQALNERDNAIRQMKGFKAASSSLLSKDKTRTFQMDSLMKKWRQLVRGLRMLRRLLRTLVTG